MNGEQPRPGLAPEPPSGDGGRRPPVSGLPRRRIPLYLVIAESVIAIAALVGIVLVTTDAFSSRDATADGASGSIVATAGVQPIYLDGAGAAGPDAFAGTLFAPAGGSALDAPTDIVHGAAFDARSGDAAGLYGGSMSKLIADKEGQLRFLQEHPEEAAAFCAALNSDPTLFWSGGNQVAPDQLAAYFAELTPVMLIHDTLVTNHGYKNGRPTPRLSLLQAGQLVLVDRRGVPRVRCECGNPLAVGVAPSNRLALRLGPTMGTTLLGVPLGLGSEGETVGFAGLTVCAEHVWNRLRTSLPETAKHFLGGKAPRGEWPSDHPDGRAFDFGGSADLMATASAWLAQNFEALSLKYIIYAAQKFKNGKWSEYTPPLALRTSANYETAYHYDHVHVSVLPCTAYSGEQWASLGEQAPVQVKASQEVVKAFVLFDSTTGQAFSRPVGTSGDQDVPMPYSGTTVTTVPARPVTIPEVTGMDVELAKSTLAMSNLRPMVTFRQTADEAPGTVLEQIPAAGTETQENGFVELVVAQEPGTTTSTAGSTDSTTATESVTVPSVMGMSLEEAAMTLNQNRLRYRVVDFVTSEAPPGQIWAQSPSSGAKVPAFTVITLRVTKQPSVAYVTVPNVTGKNIDDAIDTLSSVGLTVTTRELQTAQYPPGQVVEQNPAAGTQMAKGSSVLLVVAKAPPTTTTSTQALISVPSVIGYSEKAARTALAEVGLGCSVIYVSTSLVSITPWTIHDQDPDAGTKVVKGTIVKVFIRKTVLTTTSTALTVKVPSLYGLTEGEAKDLLAAHGLSAVVVYVSASEPLGTVVSQSPEAGTYVAPGSRVTIRISSLM